VYHNHDFFFISCVIVASVVIVSGQYTGVGFSEVKVFAKNTLNRFQKLKISGKEEDFFQNCSLTFTSRYETVNTFAREQ